MRSVTPEVFLVAVPQINWEQMREYLAAVGAAEWETKKRLIPGSDFILDGERVRDAEDLVEFGGRLCYRSWEPGLNANVSKIREDSTEYLGNILSSGHGSVLEHANFSFVFHNVSRVFTHEMVRHRAGVAVSQESMRFVRLTDLPFWFPDWARADEELMNRAVILLAKMEEHQLWMAEHFGLDDPGVPFSVKKAKTSFMRRFAPDGVATGMLCTMNVRALRHIIYMRTALGAEEEIRLVFDEVARLAIEAIPNLLEWQPDFMKV